MTINNNNAVTEILGIDSLYRLINSAEQFGSARLLLIFTQPDTVLGADDAEKKAVKSFLSNAPFMSAVVSDDEISDELISAADLVLKASEINEYTEKLFKDKSFKQISEITACFTAARNSSAEKVLELESKAFYRLMADKNGGNSNA